MKGLGLGGGAMEVRKGLARVPWRAGALHLLSARAWNCCLMGFSALWPPLSQHPSGGLPCAQRRAGQSHEVQPVGQPMPLI